jgi:PEGA domain-containing protein
MDERQTQLVAAAEATRTWIYAQRAIWAEGYPQSLLKPAQPQFATASAFVMSPSAAITPFESSPEAAWADADRGPSFQDQVAERFESTVQGTKTFVRTSWRMLAAIAAVLVVAGAVRLAWPGMKQKVTSNLAVGRQAAKDQRQALSQRVTGGKPGPANTGAAAVVKASGQLQVESKPTGAHVLIDGKDRGVTPLTVDGLSLGSHKVVIRGDDGSVQRTVSITAAEPVQLNESIYSGWLHVSAPFEIQISEGRKSITLDDSSQVLLAPGPHDLRFENRSLGVRDVRHVDIRPGETTAVSLDTPMSRLTITASEPATVSIDGQQVGETPLTDYQVPIGTRDITVTSASGQAHHQTITLKVPPTQIDVDFSKP